MATIAPSSEFTLGRLKRLLTTSTKVEWRHDIDFDPTCALKMAELEHDLGVHATYYIMISSEHYNVFNPAVTDTFRMIHALGHDLGLHVDLELGRNTKVTNDQLFKACRRVDDQFRYLFLPLRRKVSFHAPPHDIYWRDIFWFKHALGPEWEGRYIADSRGMFRDNPEHRLTTGGPLQINLHPEWWFWPPSVADHQRIIEAAKP